MTDRTPLHLAQVIQMARHAGRAGAAAAAPKAAGDRLDEAAPHAAWMRAITRFHALAPDAAREYTRPFRVAQGAVARTAEVRSDCDGDR